jgi:hypothetical protein
MNITMESSTYASEDQKSVLFSNALIVDLDVIICRALNRIKEYNYNSNDTCRLFLNFFIIEICESLKDNLSIKTIFFFNSSLPLFNREEYSLYIKLIEDALKSLYIPYIKHSFSLDVYKLKLLSKSDDELISFEKANTSFNKTKSSKKISNFLIKSGLNYLQDTYFKNPSNKLILFR